MPVHDWTKVDAGIFHDFHHAWIEEIKRALNRGLLPDGYYALAVQITGKFGPDVLALERPSNGENPTPRSAGALAIADSPPKVQFHSKSDADRYTEKAKAVYIHHASDHEVIAIVEIVSPGNKSSQLAMRTFVEKAEQIISSGIHLLIADLFPPTPRDPEGIYQAIWKSFFEDDFRLPHRDSRTICSFLASKPYEAFAEVFQVGSTLEPMPLFLTDELYVPVPLEATYQSAWDAVPAYWQKVLAESSTAN